MSFPSHTPLDTALSDKIDALCDNTNHMVISVSGSGGKTTTIEHLALLWAERGLSVLVSTTTKLAHPDIHLYPCFLPALSVEDSSVQPIPYEVILYGRDEGEKIGAVSIDELEHVSNRFDRVLIETDGARSLPLKIHTERDPVIPHFCTLAITVCGLSPLEKPLDERVMYASERYRFLTGDTSSVVNLQTYRNLFDHPEGVFKRIPHTMKTLALLNQSDMVDKELLHTVMQTLLHSDNGRSYSLMCGSWKDNRLEYCQEIEDGRSTVYDTYI